MQKQIIQGQAHTLKKNGLYNRVYFPASFKKDKHLSCKRTQKDRLPQQIAGWWVSLGKDSSYPVVR